MNTLPRAITAQVFADPNTFHSLRRHWSALMRSARRRELHATHHLLYLALVGKDWRRGFAPITNRRKLDNGAFFNWGMFRALSTLHAFSREDELLAPFDGLVTPGMLEKIRQMVPSQSAYTCQPDQFSAAVFPFDAYNAPAVVRPDGAADGAIDA